MPPNRISMIVRGTRNITADTALRLGRFFGQSPEFWMNLQQTHDLVVVERTLRNDLKTIRRATRRPRTPIAG